MSKKYDPENVFAKILDNKLPSTKIYEDDFLLCFEDISKSAPIHWLAIPKKNYVDYDDFLSSAEEKEILGFFKGVNKIIKDNDLDKKGYKLQANSGKKGGQEVFHFHMHILSF